MFWGAQVTLYFVFVCESFMLNNYSREKEKLLKAKKI